MAYNTRSSNSDPSGKIVFGAIVVGVLCLALLLLSASITIIQPGTRGVAIKLGKVDDQPLPEGLSLITPLITTVVTMPIYQQAAEVNAECFSSDLQLVLIKARVLYRFPETQVVRIYRDYRGSIAENILIPKLQESLKEETAQYSASKIVELRDEVKQKTILRLKETVGTILAIDEVVLENIDLSDDLEKAIEAKMVQQQQAAAARFVQEKTQIEAETAIIRAKGEAEAIQIRAAALEKNPRVIELTIAEKWNGVSPSTVVVSDGGNAASVLLPLPTDGR